MHRFFIPKEQINKTEITISGSDFNHIKNVLRMKEKDQIEAFDPLGKTYIAEIFQIEEKTIKAKIIEEKKEDNEPKISITLAQALPKSKKMDLIIQKGTELGIKEFIPVISERTIPKIEEKEDKKISHWGKIAKEASEQSGRAVIPRIKNLHTFDEVLKSSKDYDLALIPWEGEKESSLKTILKENSPKKILLIIGPEGGFSSREIEKAKELKVKPITLGKTILRTETASLVAVSQILYEFLE